MMANMMYHCDAKIIFTKIKDIKVNLPTDATRMRDTSGLFVDDMVP